MRRHDLLVRPYYAVFMGQRLPVAVGRGGIGEKICEGDGITPQGIWELEAWLTRPDRVKISGAIIGPQARWVDDPNHPSYNQMIARDGGISCERMARPDGLYDVVGVVNYNRAPIVAGLGSAIFIHEWRRARFPTAGCVAFARKDLHWIYSEWREDARLIIEG